MKENKTKEIRHGTMIHDKMTAAQLHTSNHSGGDRGGQGSSTNHQRDRKFHSNLGQACTKCK